MLTKRFSTLHAYLVTDNANEYAKEAASLAVKAIYSNQDPEMCLSLLNDTPQHIRKAFASWLRGFGVAVIDPIYGTVEYTVGKNGVLVTKKQHKVFEALNTAPDVLKQEMTTRVLPKEKKLTGTPIERAQSAVATTIAKLRKVDPAAAGVLNDLWARKAEVATAATQVVLRKAA